MEGTLWRLLRESINNLKFIAVGGVDFSLAGNGGTDCINFLPAYQRCLETVVFTSLGLCGIYYSMGGLEWQSSDENTKSFHKEHANGTGLTNGNAELINKNSTNPTHPDQQVTLFFRSIIIRLSTISRHFTAHKNAFFKFYAGIFMIELVYKTITRTAIFLLNPCHVCTALQLVLLRFRDEKRRPWTQQLFRFHLYTVPGALIALMFPILNTRLMVGEVFIYFVQHSLILITPIHLMSTTDVYKPEPLTNVSWPMFSISIIILYHFSLLQTVGFVTEVNLNCILCPAVSDPFNGRFYRVIAVLHQSLIIVPFFTKLYAYISTQITSIFNFCYSKKCD